jgi:hypothetical protein
MSDAPVSPGMFLSTLLCLAVGLGLGWYQMQASPYLQRPGEGQSASVRSEDGVSSRSAERSMTVPANRLSVGNARAPDREHVKFVRGIGNRAVAGDARRASFSTTGGSNPGAAEWR